MNKDKEYYQNIASVLNDNSPDNWNNIYIYSEVDEEMTRAIVYYETDSKILSAHEILLETELVILERKLVNNFRGLWNEFKKESQPTWTNCTFILNNAGKFQINYDYADLSQIDLITSRNIWAYKTLGIIPKVDYQRVELEECLKLNNLK